MKFIDTSEDRKYKNELANTLLNDLKNARNNSEWRKDFMTWRDYGNDCREEGREEGRQEGLQKGRQEGLQEGRQEGIQQANIKAIQNMVEFGLSEEQILQKYSRKEYELAKEGLLVKA